MTVRLYVWRVPRRAVPAMFWSMAVDKRKIRRKADFAKLLGTGRGSEFGVGSADLTRWAALVVTGDQDKAGDQDRDKDEDEDRAEVVPPMRGATRSCTITLEPIASRGTWSGASPFTVDEPARADGMIAVLTRARLRAGRAAAFWRAIGPVGPALATAEGLHCAFGFGEAPVGFQGTMSVWRSAADVGRFAYRRPEHAAVVARTAELGWYAEELFARFRVLGIDGDREVIGWRDGQ